MYIDTLDEIVNKYNNTYHLTIKMKLADVKSRTYIDFNKENNKKDPKVEVCGHVRISKYKNIFAKGYVTNYSEVFMIKKIKTLCRGLMLLAILTVKKFLERFTKMSFKNKSERV